MKFTSALALTGLASLTAAAYSNGTVTATHAETTVVTITSCSDNKCTAKPVTTGLTTVTDVEKHTVYTTYCPLSSEEAASSAPAAASSAAPAPVSSAPAGKAPASSAPAANAPASSAPAASAPAASAPASSAAAQPSTVAAESVSSPASSVAAEVSTAENAGARAVPALFAGVVAGLSMLF